MVLFKNNKAKAVIYIISYFLLYGFVNETPVFLGIWGNDSEWYKLPFVMYRVMAYIMNAIVAYVFLYGKSHKILLIVLLLHIDIIFLSLGGLFDKHIALLTLVGWGMIRYVYIAFWGLFLFKEQIVNVLNTYEFIMVYGVFFYFVAVLLTLLLHISSNIIARLIFTMFERRG